MPASATCTCDRSPWGAHSSSCALHVPIPTVAPDPRCRELCESCGGHGSVSYPVPAEATDLTPREQRQVERGRKVWRCEPCQDPRCCGHDHVTPLLESQIESEGW